MPHEDVVVQIDLHTAGADAGCHLIGQCQHLVAVGCEMKICPTDSARPHRNENLAGFGHRLGHVVAIDHAALTQHRCAHQLFSLSILSS
jgi:hypothetical protein